MGQIIQNCLKMIRDTHDALDILKTNICRNQSIADACQTIAELSRNGSVVVTTGMGKAGHIAQKAASSFSSLGTPSFYIHPGEASHGDVGVIRPRDILLVFPTSGKTREVVETVNFARKLNVSKVISVTSHLDSIIRRQSDITIDMGIIRESGYLGIAPTTSIVVMLVIADMLAVNVAEINKFGMKDFYIRHHGGYLGKQAKKKQKKYEQKRNKNQ